MRRTKKRYKLTYRFLKSDTPHIVVYIAREKSGMVFSDSGRKGKRY